MTGGFMRDTKLARRDFIMRAPLLAGALSAPGLLLAADDQQAPIARTTKGQLRGVRENGVIVFKGVPYAGPPDGEHHFKPPTPLESWTGVRDATEYGPQAIQNRDPNAPPNIV